MSLDPRLLTHLQAFDTPTICNALEMVLPERRLTGFTRRPFVCAFPAQKPMVGMARTATIRAADKPEQAASDLLTTRLAYYEYVAAEPQPTIVVLQDLDPDPGFGAFWGEVNTAVHKGLGVLGCITNGSIRDLDVIANDFQLLAGSVGPSHAHVRVDAIDVEVSVHGMTVRPGEVIHADRHGAVIVPEAALPDLPAAIELLTRREAIILRAARAPDFTLERLRQVMAEVEEIH